MGDLFGYALGLEEVEGGMGGLMRVVVFGVDNKGGDTLGSKK